MISFVPTFRGVKGWRVDSGGTRLPEVPALTQPLHCVSKPTSVGISGLQRDQNQLQPGWPQPSVRGTSGASSGGDLERRELHLQPEPAQVSSSVIGDTARNEDVSVEWPLPGMPTVLGGLFGASPPGSVVVLFSVAPPNPAVLRGVCNQLHPRNGAFLGVWK